MKTGWLFVLAIAIPFFAGCQTRENTVPVFETTTGQTMSSVSVDPSQTTTQTYRIDYTFELLTNHCVGNEWKQDVFYDGQYVDNTFRVTAAPNSSVTLIGMVTELDKIPDKGNGVMTLLLQDGTSRAEEIIVRENRGKYAGSTAVWKWVCTVTVIEEDTFVLPRNNPK